MIFHDSKQMKLVWTVKNDGLCQNLCKQGNFMQMAKCYLWHKVQVVPIPRCFVEKPHQQVSFFFSILNILHLLCEQYISFQYWNQGIMFIKTNVSLWHLWVAWFGKERSGTRCLYIRHNVKQSYALGEKKRNHEKLIIMLFSRILFLKKKIAYNNIQLSAEGEVNSGGYIPRHEASRYISTALQRPWGG